MFIPDPDFYPFRIPDPKTATKERGVPVLYAPLLPDSSVKNECSTHVAEEYLLTINNEESQASIHFLRN